MFSCDEGTVPDGMKPASNTDIVDYYLYVPEEWIVSTAERASTQAYASKSDRTNILVMQWNWVTTDEIKTVADWWEKEYKPQVFESGSVQNHVILVEGEEMLLDSQPAYKYSYTGKIGDSYFRYDLVICKAQGSLYVLQMTYMQDSKMENNNPVAVFDENGQPVFSSVETHKESVQKMIENFKFD